MERNYDEIKSKMNIIVNVLVVGNVRVIYWRYIFCVEITETKENGEKKVKNLFSAFVLFTYKWKAILYQSTDHSIHHQSQFWIFKIQLVRPFELTIDSICSWFNQDFYSFTADNVLSGPLRLLILLLVEAIFIHP